MVRDRGIFLSILPATDGERLLALSVLAVSLAVFVAVEPFAPLPLAQINAFIPAYESAVVINDLITVVLLFGQFAIIGKRGLLLLASGYLFTGLMAVAHMLSFPGLFAPSGLLGAGPQTTVWLFMLWHAGLPLFVLAYALDRKPDDSLAALANGGHDGRRRGARKQILIAVGAVIAAVCALTALTTAGQAWIPPLLVVPNYGPAPLQRVVVATDCLIALAALAMLWRRPFGKSGPHTVLDLWLMVVMCAWVFDVALSALLNQKRFDLGFYAGRLYGLMAASFVLLVLLLETRALFSRLARSLQRRAEELGLANTALRAGDERLRQLNETLELRVADRSRALEAEIAERTRIHESRRETQKLEAIGQMAGGIAHDFNNLLTVVVGNAGYLEHRLAPGLEQQAATTVVRAAERGARLVRQILAFSRRQSVKPEVIRLNQRQVELVDLLRRSTRGDIRIDADFPEDLWPIECDAAELELALMNLCVNARDAMPSGGLVRIHARNLRKEERPEAAARGDSVCISVTDSGTGIAADLLAKVFEPFFTTKEIGKGTGLGLSQVHGFAQQAGGAAEISSTQGSFTQGSGTTVSIILPRSVATAESEAPERKLSPDAETSVGGMVLLVEDDEDVALAAMTILGMIGYSAHHVPNAATALALLLGGERFDLMLSDIVMPGGMNGIELADKARQHFPWLPILLSTGYARPAAAMHQPSFEIIAKPYNAVSLLDAILRARQSAMAAEQIAGGTG